MTDEHVTALRLLAADKASAVPDALAQQLAAAGLVAWSGGAGKDADGRWRRLRPSGWRVTAAGEAALLFYELGRASA
jgi:hypothetical protein